MEYERFGNFESATARAGALRQWGRRAYVLTLGCGTYEVRHWA
jgi:hypothetical protein